MVPQQIPFYSPALASGAPPAYGQPGFYPSNPAPQAQGLPVQVGIPAGVPVLGSAVQQAFVHVANAGAGNVPNQQTHFAQGQQNNFAQGVLPNKAYAAPPDTNMWQGQPPCSPPPSSFPPGFEPGLQNNFSMGIPSQPRPTTVAVGGPVVHPNQHHVHQQHRPVNQGEYQHQQQYQHQHQQYQPQYQHQQHQNQQQHQPQHQHQYQHQQHQPQHQHQYQHQLHQNQHSNQHQRQHQHQHEHKRRHYQQRQVLQQDHYQQNQHSHVHPEAQQYQIPHPHSHPQLQLQTQAHPAQLQTQPQPQPQTQLQTPPQPMQFETGPQSLSQAQPAFQQVQLIPAPFSNALHAYPSNIQADCANGVAIGLPVMPTSSHVDTAAAQTAVQIQQPAPATPWQPGYLENSLQCAPQSLNNSFPFSNNVQNTGPQAVIPVKDHNSSGWQPTNMQRNDHLNIERQTDPLRQHAQVMPQMNPDSQFRVEATKPLDAQTFDQMRSNGHLASGKSHPSSSIGNNNRRWLSPPKSQMPVWANERNPLHALRGFQARINGQLKSHMNGSFSADAQKCSNGHRISQLQRQCDSRGNSDVQKRSGMQPIKCDSCDRTFTSSEVLASHLKTHVKCGEEGCTFEASGKIVKEHRVTEHGKVEIQATYRGRRALALRSMEDKEDIKRWREERKKSYPTSANILRKAEDQKRMEAEGEPIDEETQKRRQRMRDVIARQKQLGYQVPEIPSNYFHTRQDRRLKKMSADATDAKTEFVEGRNSVGLKRTADEMETSHDRATRAEDLKDDSQIIPPSNDDNEHRRGHFRKGHQSKFRSQPEGRKHYQNHDTRMTRPPPTLLSKLLHDDIQKENSYLLQCCRFIVNNAFFQDYSPTSLKHFEWIVAALPTNGDESSADLIESKASADLIESKAHLNSEMGEEVPILSNSETSACGNESNMLSDSKDSVLEAEKKVMDREDGGVFVICEPSLLNIKDFVADREPKNAPHAPATFSQKVKRKNQEQDGIHKEPPESNLSQPCRKNDAGKVESKVETTSQPLSVDGQPTCSKDPDGFLEPNNSQANHFAVDKAVTSVNTSVSSRKATSTSTHLSYDDVEAGEVVSEQSESIVEDEEDISQYMNFDANGADSGSCYD